MTWHDLNAEVQTHIDERIADLIDQGLTPAAARAQARREFGNATLVTESSRDVWRRAWLEQFAQDIRFGLRGWKRAPGFTALAVTTLALGIAASVAVFSVVDPLLFRRLPYPNDHELVSFGYFGPVDSNEFAVTSSYFDWRSATMRGSSPLAVVTSMRPAVQCDLLIGSSAQMVPCAAVEATFLPLFGIVPAIGRNFTTAEDAPLGPAVGLISHRLWQSAFAGNRKVLNETITVESGPFRIVGVLPPGFELPQLGDIDILRPARLNPGLPRAANASGPLRTFGRLRPGVSIEQARLQLQPLMQASGKLDVPAELQSEVQYVVRSLRDRRIRDVKTASFVLLGATLAFVWIACLNVTNLLIGRAAARRREFAIRKAIGAAYWRLVRQSLTESALLGLAGCLAGCTLGWLVLKIFSISAPLGLLRLDRATVNARVLMLAALITLASVLIAGLLPALDLPWRDGKAHLRKALVIAQVALAVVLLTGASLLLRSLNRIVDTALGFRPHQVVTAAFTLRQPRYNSPEAQAAFGRELEARLSRLAAAGAFALTDSLPPLGYTGRPYSNIRVVNGPPLAANGGMVAFRRVTPSYFRVLGIPLLSGRFFTEADRTSAEDPILISDSLSRKMFPWQSPLGRRLVLSDDNHASRIIGVVGDVRNNGLTEPASPEYYRLRMADGRQLGRATVALFQTDGSSQRLSAFIRRELAALDSALPVEISTLDQRVRGYQERPRFLATLFGSFAGIGLLLAVTGLYGVLSLLVQQRAKEVGIRLAVGAQRREIAWMFRRQALTWTVCGLALGLVGARFLARTMRALLFEVAPSDPVAILSTIVLLAITALIGTWLPTRRATRIDPVQALRTE